MKRRILWAGAALLLVAAFALPAIEYGRICREIDTLNRRVRALQAGYSLNQSEIRHIQEWAGLTAEELEEAFYESIDEFAVANGLLPGLLAGMAEESRRKNTQLL